MNNQINISGIVIKKEVGFHNNDLKGALYIKDFENQDDIYMVLMTLDNFKSEDESKNHDIRDTFNAIYNGDLINVDGVLLEDNLIESTTIDIFPSLSKEDYIAIKDEIKEETLEDNGMEM